MPTTTPKRTPEAVATNRRPLRRDAERNRRRILAAAAEAFAAGGLTVTMDEIAEVAGIGVGTVYRRFPDKRELIDALFEDRIDQMAALAGEAATDPDPWHGLVSFLEQSMAIEAANRGLAELLRYGINGCDGVGRARERVAPLVATLLRRAQESGQVRADLEATDLMVMKGMLLTVAHRAHDFAPDLWRRYFTLMLETLRARPADHNEPLPVPALSADQLAAAASSLQTIHRHNLPLRGEHAPADPLGAANDHESVPARRAAGT